VKGTIINCLRDLVCDRFGEEKWHEIMRACGLDENLRFMYSSDVEDRGILSVFEKLRAVLGWSRAQAADAFGDYWINVYAVKIYHSYFAHFTNVKEFLLGLNDLHERITADIPNAKPPRFKVTEPEPGLLRLRYLSGRGLIDFAAGLVRGVGTYFKTPLDVKIMPGEEIEVRLHG